MKEKIRLGNRKAYRQGCATARSGPWVPKVSRLGGLHAGPRRQWARATYKLSPRVSGLLPPLFLPPVVGMNRGGWGFGRRRGERPGRAAGGPPAGRGWPDAAVSDQGAWWSSPGGYHQDGHGGHGVP